MNVRPPRAPTSVTLAPILVLTGLTLFSCVSYHTHYPDEGVQETPAPTVAPPNQNRDTPPRGQPGRSPAVPATPAPPPPAEPPPPPIARTPPAPPAEPAPPPPVVRPAPHRQGRLAVSLVPAKAAFLPDESIPVRVVLANTGPGAAVVYEMRRAFMNFSLVDERGRVTVCQREDADMPRRIEAGRFLRMQPGSALDHSVHLDRFCGELSPGTWQVRLAYVLPPAFDGAAFGLFATTGTFETSTTIRVDTPAPRTNLSLSLSRTRRTRADEPFEVTLRLHNRGPDAGLVLPPGPGTIVFDVSDARGRPVSCNLPAGRTPRRADFVSLASGQHLETTTDLARHCDLRAGDYEILATYEVDPSVIRGLPQADSAGVVLGRVTSNRLPFEREAARPRATVRLEASLPVDVVSGQGAIPVMLLAVNEGPDQVVLAVPGAHLVTARLEREGGGSIGCRVPQGPAPEDAVRTRRVRPGAAATGQVDLRALCDLDQPGRYHVTVTYTVPEEGAGSDEWTGTATAAPIPLTIERERRASPAPRPARPALEPEPAHPDRSPRYEAEPELFLSGPERIRAGEPLEMQVELAAGGEDLVVGSLASWMVSWTVQDRYGRLHTCALPPAPSRPPNPSDFVTLPGRRSMSISVDLARACGIDEPGRYFVTAQLHLPRSWSGRHHRMDAWTGTLVASPVVIEVNEARGRGRGH